MNTGVTNNLNPDKALIFRIIHRNNIPWILDHGLCCSNHNDHDPDFVPIGHPEVISRRQHRTVPLAPGGTLGDYIPFYFTPYSPMMYNIHTGRGVPKRANEEIAVLVCSLPHIIKAGHSFVFTDRHAYLATANYYNNINQLNCIDFELLRSRNFKRDPENPEPFDRYQAEALIHHQLPAQTLLGIVCYTETVVAEIQAELQARNMTIKTIAQPSWYF